MGLWIRVNQLKSVSNRLDNKVYLRRYLKSDEWNERRLKYLKLVGSKSEISGEFTNIVHHLKYIDIRNKNEWGTESNRYLMAVTFDEHKKIHTIFSSISKFKNKLIKAFENDY